MNTHYNKYQSSRKTDMNWFKPIDNSLAKLNSVKARMYNVELDEGRTRLEGVSSRRDRPFRRAGSHSDLRVNVAAITGQSQSEPSSPPVFADPRHAQGTAWTNSTSIPDLVSQLTARLKKRSTSNIKLQLTRMRPQSSKQRSARGKPPRQPVKIAVKGSSCQMSGRQQQTDHLDNVHHEAYSRFNDGTYYDKNPRAATSKLSEDDREIPPPPRCSPVLGETSDSQREKSDTSGQPSDASGQPSDTSGQPSDASGQPSDTSGQPSDTEHLPQHSCRPTPDVIHLSLPTAEMDTSIEVDTARLIEDDQLYAPLTLHKERDATQSSLTPTMTGSGQETEMSVDDLLDSLVLEDIKSFHHYPGPADDLRVKTTETKLDTHDVERETLPRQRTQPQKTRYVHTRGRTNARLKQVMTSLSEKRRSEMELLKKQAAVGENVVTAVSTTEKKTGEVEQMIHTLQLNLAMNGANNTEINSKDLPCEPVLLTKTCCTSKRTQNYYEYARKNKMLSNISQSPVSAEEPVAKTIKTLELNGDLVVEQKVVAKIEEPPLQQKLQQHSPRLKHCMRTNKKPGLPLAPSRKEVGSEQGTGKNTAQLAGDKSIHPGREKTAVPRQFSARGRAVTAAKSSPQMGVRPPATCHTAVAVAAVPPRVTTAPVDSRCKDSKGVSCHNHDMMNAPVKHRIPDRRVSESDVMRSNYRRGSSAQRMTLARKQPSVQVVEVWTQGHDFEVETEGLEDCRRMQQRLLEKNIPVSLDTLKRALLPPTEYARRAPSYQSSSPAGLPTSSSGLLSSPSVWLAAEYKKVQEAQKAVRMATQILDEQQKKQGQKVSAKARIKSAPPGSAHRQQ